MKRLVYFIPLWAVAVLAFASIALAQSMDQTQSADQTQSPDQAQGTAQPQSPAAGVDATPVQNTATVDIRDQAFDPDPVSVDPGTTVTWVNQDSVPHTATADDGSFDSGILNPGESFSAAFDGSGTLGYHSTLDPAMQGSVEVVGSGSSGVGATPVGNTTSDTSQTPTDSSTQSATDPTQLDPSQMVGDTIDMVGDTTTDMPSGSL